MNHRFIAMVTGCLYDRRIDSRINVWVHGIQKHLHVPPICRITRSNNRVEFEDLQPNDRVQAAYSPAAGTLESTPCE